MHRVAELAPHHGVLLVVRGLGHLLRDIGEYLLGFDDAVAVGVGGALHALLQILGEEAVGTVGVLSRCLAAARREEEHHALAVAEGLAGARALAAAAQTAREAGVDEELLVVGVTLAQHGLDFTIADERLLVVGIVGAESALAAMTAEEEDHNIVLARLAEYLFQRGEHPVVGGVAAGERGDMARVGLVELCHRGGIVLQCRLGTHRAHHELLR